MFYLLDLNTIAVEEYHVQCTLHRKKRDFQQNPNVC